MLASTILNQAIKWLGKNEYDGSHKEIIDIYNRIRPLPRGYKVKYKGDAWCATYISAVAIKCGATDIIPIECSCGRMIELAQKKGIWVENDAYTPKPADIILYDWDDSGKGDNKGWADHVGYVINVNNGKIKVVEGNLNNKVGYREIAVNGRYIRGYICPKYEAETKEAEKPTESTPESITAIAKDVINGKYGNGAERKKRLESLGYNYAEVQAEVNRLLSPKKKTLEEVAKEVLNGDYGNGAERKKRIPAETGYTYQEVQNKVNEILKK